jgi:putative tricarboxylic transport membrane protein
MGPGYFPFLMAVVLLVLGVGTTVEGLIRAGEPPSGTNLRGIALVTGGVMVFALAIRPLGLVPTVAITSFLFAMADRDLRNVPSAVAAIDMALASWLIFVVALGMPWRAFP